MKRFCTQLENTDAAVFSVFNQPFLFSANTLTYFPITDCAKDLLLAQNLDFETKDESIKQK